MGLSLWHLSVPARGSPKGRKRDLLLFSSPNFCSGLGPLTVVIQGLSLRLGFQSRFPVRVKVLLQEENPCKIFLRPEEISNSSL